MLEPDERSLRRIEVERGEAIDALGYDPDEIGRMVARMAALALENVGLKIRLAGMERLAKYVVRAIEDYQEGMQKVNKELIVALEELAADV